MTACSFHKAVPELASRKPDFLLGANADILILQEVRDTWIVQRERQRHD